MSTLSFTAQQLYNMLTDAHCNCKQYISVDQDDSLILANESRNSYGVFEGIPITKDFIIEYDLTLGSNSNPCCNPTFGSYIKPNSAQYYGFMLTFSSGGELWRGENNLPATAQQSLGMSGTAWYGTPNTTYHIKIERNDNTVNLYVDDVLTQTVSNNTIRTTEGGYFGFFNWDGYTCKISNVTVTSDTYSDFTETINYVNKPGLAEIWANTKNYISAQLLGKSDVGHTHSASDITSGLSTVATSGSYNDLSNTPTIPSKTSDLTNDSGFITSDNTKIPLAGSNQISGSLIPATDNAYNLGDSSHNYKIVYVKGIKHGLNSGVLFLSSGNGANIELYGNNAPLYAGWVSIKAVDNNGLYHMILKPDGTFKWGSKNVAMAEDVVPRSGGGVMTSNRLGRVDVNGELSLCGGMDLDYGSSVCVFGKSYPNYGLPGAIRLIANDGSNIRNMYMYPSGTWKWEGQAVQLVSDQRLKQQITEIDDKLLNAWEDVNPVQFKYNDAVDQKKDKARLHTGYVVQQIDNACKSHNVDISEYGLYCHEEYPEETEEVEVEQADGTKVKETKVIREASEHYSLRYTEVYAVECMYLRRCIRQLTARIEELEKGNNTK